MDVETGGEVLGYVAAFFVLLTFWMKTMIPLRVIGLISNFLFIGYGYLAAAYPPLVLHIVLLPLNYVRLREMRRLTQQVKAAARGDLDMDWLKPFTAARTARSGERIFHKGDAAEDMFYVASGRYRLIENRPGARSRRHARRARPGRSRRQTNPDSRMCGRWRIAADQL